MRRLACFLLLILPATHMAAAQSDSSAGRGEVSPRITPAFGLHYGSPLRISGTLGVIVDLNRKTLDGILLLAEPGQNGIGFSTGYLKMIGRFGSGVSLRASAIHTYDHPWEANPQTTYVGGEVHWMVVLGVGGRAGLFKRASGNRGSHDTLGTLGFSIGI